MRLHVQHLVLYPIGQPYGTGFALGIMNEHDERLSVVEMMGSITTRRHKMINCVAQD